MSSIIRLVLTLLSLSYTCLGLTQIDMLMRRHGLVDVRTLNQDILVDLRYSTENNFVGIDMYGDLQKAYLERGFAQRVASAQSELSRVRPGYRLIIYDAARPMSTQRRMYELVEGTPLSVYVAPAKRGGRHNYGVAVDLSIVDDKGNTLDMGSDFDHFGETSHMDKTDSLYKQGKISAQVVQNRQLLTEVMRHAGLHPYVREWWHYQEFISMSEVRKRYKRLDF